jgi:hypothetical protein
MKVEIVDDNTIVFLNKYITKNLDYKDSKVLEPFLKKVFYKLELYYDIRIKGYYDVYIYVDNNYGAIFELVKDDLDYLEYDDSLIDMKIIVSDVKSLYKLNDVINLKVPYTLYNYKNNIYLDLDVDIDNIDEGYLLENSILI